MNTTTTASPTLARFRNLGSTLWVLVKETAVEWYNGNTFEVGAALAYYTVFSLAPILVIAISIASLVFPAEAARGQLKEQLSTALGSDVAEAVTKIMESSHNTTSGVVATILGIVALVVGATSVFAQLQQSLNSIWGVKPGPNSGILDYLKGRLFSFSVVCGIGFLLLVSLVVSTALQALATLWTPPNMPGGFHLLEVVNWLISFAIVTLLFAMIYKLLPDVKIAWEDVWVGALVTALLFTVGKSLIAVYLVESGVASAYGTAGSLAIILMWVFYSSQIFLFGAEFTKVYAQHSGKPLVPARNAVLVQPHGQTPGARS